MYQNLNSAIAVIGIDIGKNSFHVVGLDDRGAIVLRQKWSRGQIEARLANMPPCLIGMEACVGAHHLSRKPKVFGHEASSIKFVPSCWSGAWPSGRAYGSYALSCHVSWLLHLMCCRPAWCGSSGIWPKIGAGSMSGLITYRVRLPF